MGKKCQHDGCSCTVERADAFCSEHCREAEQKGATSGRGCRCGHSGCTAEAK